MINKKIVFFTESPGSVKYIRGFPNARVEIAWQIALDAQHIPLLAVNDSFRGRQYDLGIIIIPKKFNEHQYFTDSFWSAIRMNCNKIAIMQEGPSWYFQDYSVVDQFNYCNVLDRADFLLCHNISDVNYYRGLTGKNTYVMQSLMITDSINKDDIFTRKDAVIIGGNFCSWYSGFLSYRIASYFDKKMYAVSMGRKQSGEKNIEDIEYLPYMNWFSWMMQLRKMKYAVHLMRTYAAGTFALNTSIFGIPTIGYENLDTQRILHPSTTVKEGDLYRALEIAQQLKTDADFYELCSKESIENYEKYYLESQFLMKFEDIIKKENI